MQHEDERLLLGFFRKLGCIPLKTIRPGHGSSLHYGGTFPIVPESDDPLTCDRTSRSRSRRACARQSTAIIGFCSAMSGRGGR